MPRYAVAIFFEKEVPGKEIGSIITKQALRQSIVEGISRQEALGKVIHDTESGCHGWPILYHKTTEIIDKEKNQ